jgi:cysteine desulfurase / selenocysteine lyase
VERLYLDNAATSFPKPPGVYEAMLDYGQRVGASPGRGQYAASREGAALILQCRRRVCDLLGAADPSTIVFALNTTDALNLAIKGVHRKWRLSGTHRPCRFVTTDMDHNSVLRPLHALSQEGAQVVAIQADPVDGRVSPQDLREALRTPAALAVINMASNVGGTIQRVHDLVEVCRRSGTPVLLDGAQALGHLPVDVAALGVEFLAFPGHKGLMGPQGTGGLYVRPDAGVFLATTREGGTGSWSESDAQPEGMPERLEAGSHNTVGIVGLSHAVRWILDRGVESLRAHELSLIEPMLDGLRAGGVRHPDWTSATGGGPLSSFRLLGPATSEHRTAVFGLVHDSLSPHHLAAALEATFGILARAGLTCAPGAHRTFSTLDRGGALRLSFGPFVQPSDVPRLLESLACVAADTTADPACAG